MAYWRTKKTRLSGMTLVEILVAMAIIVIVFAAIMPQIRAIQNSWGSKRKTVEAIQNGRVLMDHITFNLTQANKVTAVSDFSEVTGYIEFEDHDGNTMRYEVGVGSLVQFGPVGNLSELAGPVSQLQFSCYDACDLDTPITDVNQIRSVKVQSTFTNTAALARDQSFTARAYLRTNSLGGVGELTVTEEPGAEFEFDPGNGANPVLSRIDNTHHLCAYEGPGGKGTACAVVLIVDTANWTITKGPVLAFDAPAGKSALARVDAINYLCAYTGPADDGWAVVLTVNPVTWAVSNGAALEFDPQECKSPALSQIDSDDYLCVYRGFMTPSVGGSFARVLTVDVPTRTVTAGPTLIFDPDGGGSSSLARIDDEHHLCMYSGSSAAPGSAVILTVDTVTKTVTKEGSLFVFDTQQAMQNRLCKIDQNHYLAAYRGWNETGFAFIFTVDTSTWAISKGATIVYDDKSEYAALAWISGEDYLCAYAGTVQGGTDIGKALALSVDTQSDIVSRSTDIIHDAAEGANPDLSKVDDLHFLCVYKGERGDGFATILTVGSPVRP